MNTEKNFDNFLFYQSWWTTAQRLIDRGRKDDALDFLAAIIKFGLYRELPDEQAAVWLMGFDTIKYSIEHTKANYRKQFEISKEDLENFLAEGLTYKQIAEHYKCSDDTIYRRVKMYGLEAAKKAGPQDAEAETAPHYHYPYSSNSPSSYYSTKLGF